MVPSDSVRPAAQAPQPCGFGQLRSRCYTEKRLFMIFIWPAFEPYADTLLLVLSRGHASSTSVETVRSTAASQGPCFWVAAIVAALMEAGIWNVDENALWSVVLVGVALAFLIEWRAVGRQGHSSRA